MPGNFHVRPASTGDAEALSVFAIRLFQSGGRPGADPAHIQQYVDEHLQPQHFLEIIADPNLVLLVAESDSVLVGFVLMANSASHRLVAGNASELRKLYVDPSLHGKGVADALVQAGLAHTLSRVWLSVFSENPRAVRFYERCGFRVIGRHVFVVGEDPQEDFVLLREET